MAPRKSKASARGGASSSAANASGTSAQSAAAAAAATAAGATALTAQQTLSDQLAEQGIVATFAASARQAHRNSRDINVTSLTVMFHGVPILEDTELVLNHGNRYGLLGKNGCGKSTFLRVIAARAVPLPAGIDVCHVSHEVEPSDASALASVMAADEARTALELEADAISSVLGGTGRGGGDDEAADESTTSPANAATRAALVASLVGESEDELTDRLGQIYERLEELDSAHAEARAARILSGLGFTTAMQRKATREFSGGWRMRIALARALFLQPTLLLLDEPTNHLDMEAVVWLEEYLRDWHKLLIVVSHAAEFLNSVCTDIINLTQKSLIYYGGNYDAYVQTRAELEEHQMKRYESEQADIRQMKDYIARFGHGSAKLARQAQSKEKTLARMEREGLTERVAVERAWNFRFLDPGTLPPPVLQLQRVSFGYPGSPLLYRDLELGVDMDSRIALVGPNGAGKTTLLKIMAGELIPVSGQVRPHSHLRISRYTQHFVDLLDLDCTPLEYFTRLYTDFPRDEARKFLGRYGVSGQEQMQVMRQLSDGQKSRVVFAKMAKEAPHMLFLDEPTNNLDMETIDSLARAINEFAGGMVLVSHDMRLISQVAREIWICQGGAVTRYAGDIHAFKMELRSQIQAQMSGAAAASP